MTAGNVVLVTVDSLRYDRTGAERNGRPTTPRIDEFATDAVTFDQAIANGPNTLSSFPTILTSVFTEMYGGKHYLDEQRPFLADRLQQAGFATAGFHSNPHLGTEQNYHRGFDTFDDSLESGSESVATLKDRVESRLDPDSRLYRLLRRLWHYFSMSTETSAYTKAPEITDKALDWIRDGRDRDRPFFLWLHYMDVHYPFTPPDEHLRALDVEPLGTHRTAELNGRMQESPEDLTERDVADLLKLYDGDIRFTDAQIGRVFDELNAQDLLDDTHVFVTADHGEAFGEHDRFGHHHFPYDELLHVPLYVRSPDATADRVDDQVSLVDIGPTIYDLLDLETPGNVQGQSFRPLLQGEAMDERPAIVMCKGGEIMAIRTAEWKLIWYLTQERTELYHLASDPGEREECSAEHPETATDLKERLETYERKVRETDTDTPDPERSDEVKRRLEDLGYVD